MDDVVLRWGLRRTAVVIVGLAVFMIPFAFLPGVEVYENDCFGRIFSAAHRAPCELPSQPTEILPAGGFPLAICLIGIALFALAFFRWPRILPAALASFAIIVISLLSAALANHVTLEIFSLDQEYPLWPARLVTGILVMVIAIASLVLVAILYAAITRARARRRPKPEPIARARVIRG